MQSNAHSVAYRQHRPTPLLLLRETTVEDASRDERRLLAPASLARLEPEAASDWKQAHERLVTLGKARAAHERDVCRWLLAAQRLGVHTRTGYASLVELGERLLGFAARQTEERLRVGRALGDLRRLDGALASGELSWSAVRELTRVATRDTEQAWLDWAKTRRVRQIEAAVAAREPGDGPRDQGDPSLVKHRLSFDVRAKTMALFRDLQSAVRADLGGKADDDALLYEIARRALGGPSDSGRSSYQLTVARCDECARSRIDAGGTSHVVDDAVAEMAQCDGRRVESQSQDADPDLTAAAGATPLSRAPKSPHVRDRRARATQTVPPATRRAVVLRDHQRCVVTGSSNHRYVDVHHLDPRSEGGGHAPERLVVLCGAHHRAVHTGVLRIDGSATRGFVFRHGDGTPYGSDVAPAPLDQTRQVLAILAHMGFKPSQARAMIDEAIRAGADGGTEALLRAALRGS